MVHNTKVAKRPRGRPQIRPDEETLQLIIVAAREEFHASGFAGASMVQVARRAGVSTKTMYRLIPTKADLFRSMISDRIAQFILELDQDALDALPIEQALEHILIAYGALTFDEDTVFNLRLVFAESDRFPDLAASFAELAIRRTTQTMEQWLRRQRDLGRVADRGSVDRDRHAARHDDHGTAARHHARPAHAAGSRRDRGAGPLLRAPVPGWLPGTRGRQSLMTS